MEGSIMARDLLDRLCDSVDAATMWPHLEAFAERVKLSGTPEELESFRYLQHTLDSYGFVTRLIHHQAYISLPGKARIEVDGTARTGVDGMAPRCITHSMSLSSSPGGTRADIVYAGAGREDDYANRDVRGKIVLLDGMATPAATRQASLAGAIGQIHISPHEHIHEMCVSPVWGSPTEETRGQLPTTVVVSIDKQAGEAMKARIAVARTRAMATRITSVLLVRTLAWPLRGIDLVRRQSLGGTRAALCRPCLRGFHGREGQYRPGRCAH